MKTYKNQAPTSPELQNFGCLGDGNHADNPNLPDVFEETVLLHVALLGPRVPFKHTKTPTLQVTTGVESRTFTSAVQRSCAGDVYFSGAAKETKNLDSYFCTTLRIIGPSKLASF